MPHSIPNYLTVDPVTGAVGATFTGKIAAKGVLLDDGIAGGGPSAPGPANAVMWHPPSMPINARDFGNASARIDADDSAGGPGAYALSMLGGGNGDFLQVGPNGISGQAAGQSLIFNNVGAGGPSIVRNQDQWLSVVGDTGYVAGPSYLPAGWGYVWGPVSVTPLFKTMRSGGTCILLLTCVGEAQHNGVNGTGYLYWISFAIDGIGYYIQSFTPTVSNTTYGFSGAIAIPISPTAHTYGFNTYCSASPAIGLYNWRVTASIL